MSQRKASVMLKTGATRYQIKSYAYPTLNSSTNISFPYPHSTIYTINVNLLQYNYKFAALITFNLMHGFQIPIQTAKRMREIRRLSF